MAGPEIQATMTFDRDPRLAVRDHNKFLNQSLRAAAVFHHQKHIPRHFQHFAAAKYRYAPRGSGLGGDSRGYQNLKDRLGLPPLVSPRVTGGRTKHLVTTQRQVTATRNRARLVMRLPFRGGTGRFRLKPGQRELSVNQKVVLQIIAEIETIAPDEQRTINKLIGSKYAELANARVSAKVRQRFPKK